MLALIKGIFKDDYHMNYILNTSCEYFLQMTVYCTASG